MIICNVCMVVCVGIIYRFIESMKEKEMQNIFVKFFFVVECVNKILINLNDLNI